MGGLAAGSTAQNERDSVHRAEAEGQSGQPSFEVADKKPENDEQHETGDRSVTIESITPAFSFQNAHAVVLPGGRAQHTGMIRFVRWSARTAMPAKQFERTGLVGSLRTKINPFEPGTDTQSVSTADSRRRNVDRLRHPPSVALPGSGAKINLPSRPALAWYAGLGAMAALELIEWPFALVIAGTHFLENHSRSREVQELAEGIEAGI